MPKQAVKPVGVVLLKVGSQEHQEVVKWEAHDKQNRIYEMGIVSRLPPKRVHYSFHEQEMADLAKCRRR